MKENSRYWRSSTKVLVAVIAVFVAIHLVDYNIINPKIFATRKAFVIDRMRIISREIEWKTCYYFDSIYDEITLNQGFINNLDSIYAVSDRIIASDNDFIAADVLINQKVLPNTSYHHPTINPFAKQRYQDIIDDSSLCINPNYDLNNFLQNRLDYISEPYISKVCNNSRIVTMTIPYFESNSSISAIFSVAISIDSMYHHIQSVIPYSNTKVYAISQDGVFVMHPDSSMVTRPAYPWFEKEYGSIPYEITSNIDDCSDMCFRFSDDYEMIFCSSYDHQSKWKILCVVPTSDTTEDLASIFYSVNLISLLGICIIVFVCFLNIRSTAREKAKDELIKNELKTAAEIQASMLSNEVFSYQDLDVNANLMPARMVGGDLYNYYVIGDMLYFCIGDVSGKGIPASIFMSRTLSIIRCVASTTELSPANYIEMINRELCINNDQFLFVTLFFGILNLKTGLLCYCNAGHEYPVLLRNNTNDDCSPYFLKTVTNLPIGVDADFKYKEEQILLDENYTIFLYTDGVDEATDSKDNLYGKSRILKQIEKTKGMRASDINANITSDIKSFTGDNEQSDDITILTINCFPKKII